MSKMENDRRMFLKHVFSACVVLGGGGFLLSCGGGKKDNSTTTTTGDAGVESEGKQRFGGNCDDFSKLTEADYQVRERLGYEPESPTEETQCNSCNLWLPPRPNETCGGCTLFTGPIEPKGTCTYWAPRQS